MKHLQFKRIISMLLTIAMLLTMVPATFAASASDFTDFPTGWSKEAMAFSVDNGLLNGKSANRIEPVANLTRAEMATIINRAFGAKVTADISRYSDVKQSDWFYVEMQKAVNMQTFNGDGNGRLRPNDAITREEVMAVIARAMVLEQTDYSPLNKFADSGKFADWAKPYAAALVAGGYVNGLGNGKINPKVNITREEFAQLMYNIFKTYISEQGTYNSVTPKNCVMINQSNVALNNVTIYGDLVLGDGVGSGFISLTNVKIMGRLLARGGNITLTNVTTENGVVVKNVNGTTHFNNFKTEPVFNGVRELTFTTYKQTGIAIGGGGGGGGGFRPPVSDPTYYTYTINYYYMDRTSLKTGTPTWTRQDSVTASIVVGSEVIVPDKPTYGGYNYVLNTTKSTITPGSSFTVNTDNIVYSVYYDLQTVKVEHSDGSTEFVPVKTEETPEQVFRELKEQGYVNTKTGAIKDGNTYGIEWSLVGPNGQIQTITDWDQVIPEGWHIAYKFIANVTIIRDENTSEEITVYVGDTIPAEKLNVDPKNGYDFDGWYDIADSTKKYDYNTPVVKSPLTIKAKWTAINYTISYVLNGGTFVTGYTAPEKYTIEDAVTLPDADDIVKSGYEFDGWYNTADFTGIKVTEIVAGTTGKKTFYAKWRLVTVPPTTYTVAFVRNGGSWAQGYTAPAKYTKGVTLALPVAANVVRDGYKFDGWYENSNFTGNAVTEIPADATGDKTYYAKWLKKVKVTYVYGNGEANLVEDYIEGDVLAKPTDPVFDGHVFAGWYTAETGGDVFSFSYTIGTADIIIYARWDQFYNVNFYYFNEDLDRKQLDYVAKINVANEDADRDLAFLNKTLDGIYDGYGVAPYVYNRTDLAHPNLDVEYEHEVNAEYIYLDDEGKWSVFTEDTVVNKDIDVYYATKQAVLTIINAPGLSDRFNTLPVDVLYDSESRLADSVKDILIAMGITLSNDYIRPEIDEKIVSLYTELGDKTGMIDTQGNILDKDYGMKIIDVIDYDQIQAEVKLHIENMLNGTPEDLQAVVGLIDIGTLVEEIGARELINAIGVASLRDMIKSEEYKSKTLAYIIDKVTNDSSVIAMVLNSDAKDSLINSAASNDKFIIALIDNTTFQTEILSILKTEKKTQLLQYLEKEALRNELLSIIKKDSRFNSLIDNDDFMADVTETVKDSAAFEDILTGDGAYKQQIIEQIKDEKLESLVEILNTDDQFKKNMVEKVAEPDTDEADRTELATKTKDAIINIINTKDEFAQYRDYTTDIAYNAIVYYYVYGKNSTKYASKFRIQPAQFKSTYKPMIDGVIDEIIDSYFSYKNGETTTKPDGYDVMDDYFESKSDEVIENVITSYVDGDYDNAAAGSSDAKIKEFIDDELASHIEDAITDYVDPDTTMDADVEKLIDDTLIGFVKDYLNGVSLDEKVVEIIEANIIGFVKDYFSGNSTLTGDEEIASLADGIKTEFIKKVKNADVAKIQQPIIDFVSDEANADFVETFVSDNYTDIVDAVDDNFISNYINSMSDKELNDLVKEYADVDMIVDHIVNLTPEDRKNLANKIVDFLDSYKPFVDFMDAFKNKRDTFEVNIDNIHFVSAVGNAIYGFDFDEILEILKGKGFDKVIEFVGEDVVKDIFNASKENYWKGLEPVIEAVKADKVPREYTTSMNVAINVPLILEALYDNNANKFIDKVVNTEIYDYDKNTALKELVNLDWFDLFIGYDAARVVEATGMTGYYIRDYMDYYTAVLDIMILFDGALCFYDRAEYDDAEMIEVKKSLTKDVINFLKNLESLSDRIENGEPIYGGFTLEALINKVDSLNKVVDSVGNGALAGFEGTIETVVNNIKNILTNLGEGELPAGYTLDDLNALAQKLINVIEGMNEGEYERVNEDFNEVIAKSLTKLDSILDELDADGTIAGRPVDAIFSKISVLNRIYTRFASEIKSIISILADADFDSIDFEADIEKYEDIIFGREEDDIFNIDSVVELVKDRFDNETVEGGYYDAENGYYVIDEYSKEVKEYGVSFQRRFN